MYATLHKNKNWTNQHWSARNRFSALNYWLGMLSLSKKTTCGKCAYKTRTEPAKRNYSNSKLKIAHIISSKRKTMHKIGFSLLNAVKKIFTETGHSTTQACCILYLSTSYRCIEDALACIFSNQSVSLFMMEPTAVLKMLHTNKTQVYE